MNQSPTQLPTTIAQSASDQCVLNVLPDATQPAAPESLTELGRSALAPRDQSISKMAPIVLCCDQLSKTVQLPNQSLTILSGISLSISAGERIAIVGASGSGKSTLLSLLAGLDRASAGRIELAGTPMHDLDEDARAKLRAQHVGFVFQAFQLLPSLTALENVMLPLELQGAPHAPTRAQRILQDVGLGARLSHYPKQLSGGEQQRVAIARAFVCTPKILFADEPTGNLDRTTGDSIVNLLFELNEQQNTTLILVTHDLQLANRCDRQIRLDSGRVVS